MFPVSDGPYLCSLFLMALTCDSLLLLDLTCVSCFCWILPVFRASAGNYLCFLLLLAVTCVSCVCWQLPVFRASAGSYLCFVLLLAVTCVSCFCWQLPVFRASAGPSDVSRCGDAPRPFAYCFVEDSAVSISRVLCLGTVFQILSCT